MSRSTKVFAVFCLAALLSATLYGGYSAWVDSLDQANYERRAKSDDFRLPDYNPEKAEQVWAAENIRISKYADRKWPIFGFSFPLAMTFALLISSGAGWLPRFPLPRMVGALVPIFVIPWLLLILFALSRGVLLIPAMALAAYLLKLSIVILTSHPPRRFVLSLVLVSIVSAMLYLVLTASDRSTESLAIGLFIIVNEVTAAVLFAKALMAPLATSTD